MCAAPRGRAPRLVGLVATFLTLGGAAGCGDTTFFIRRIVAPSVSGNACVYPANPSATPLLEGVLDLAFRRRYTLAPLLQSSDSGADGDGNRRVDVEGFVVELREDSPDGPLIAGADFSNPFTVYQSSVVVPGADAQPGFEVAPFEAVPLPIGDVLYNEVCVRRRGEARSQTPDCPASLFNVNVTKRVIVRVKSFGRTAGGGAVETPPFNFALTVCCGCLRLFPPVAEVDEDAGVGLSLPPQCNTALPPPTPAFCAGLLGQDFQVPCGLCAEDRPSVCQPPGYSARAGVSCR